MRRLICKAIGCFYDGGGHCRVCRTHIYNGFIEREYCWFGWVYSIFWTARHWFWVRHHKCSVCGLDMYRTERSACSEECEMNEIPF
jgi:hypothetical protein